MFYSKTEKNDKGMIAKSMFRPCLWFKTKFETEKLSYHTNVIFNLRSQDDFDKLTSKEKKRILHEIFQGDAYYDPEKASEKTIEDLKQLNAFMDSNYRFEKANEEFLECMWAITKSRDYVNSNEKGNKFMAAMRIVKSYQNKNGFPYHWASSDTLYKSIYPIVYITQSIREHCILLAWRVVFLCLEIAVSSIDPCDNLANILKHSDESLSTNPISERYIKSKAHLMYAYVIINQIIPCHMRQIAGTLSNQATSSGAIVMPELDPYVASSFSVFVMSMIQQNFLINASQHFLKKQIKREMLINIMAHLLNGKERKQSGDEDDSHDKVEEKAVYVSIVNSFIDLCYDNQDIIHMISAIFQLSYQSCVDLEKHVWNHQLMVPYHDIMVQNIDDILPSKISMHEREFIIKMHAGSEKEKEEAMITIMRRSNHARNMHNYLLGTCVLMECYMSCFHISQILIHETPEAIMPMLVNLAKKVEMLMLPIFDRRQSAVEIMAWIIDQFRVRMMMNSDIERLFSIQNEERIAIGKQISYVWKFMVVDRNQPDQSSSGDFFTTMKTFVSSMMPSKDPKKVRNGTQLKDILKKTRDSFVDEQDEIDLPENTQHYRKLSLPFNDDDIKLWAVIISYYSHVNDEKMKEFSRIELYSYYKTPSKVLIPHGFCKDFNDMLMNMAKATSKN